MHAKITGSKASNFSFVISYKVGICKITLAILLLFSLPIFAQQQDLIKVMTYNLLNYPDNSNFTSDTTNRNPHFRNIINFSNPDIILIQEVYTQDGINSFLNAVLNASTVSYAAGTFINGPDSDNGIFFKSSKFQFISNTPIKTELRDINEFKLKHLLSGDTVRIFSLHLKSSTGVSNEAQRAREVDSLRKFTNALPNGTNFILGGDFNIYSSTESAYIKLMQIASGKQGHFIDPITMTGSFNQSIYASHHTQSPRTRNFGGGASGGMDDRFDMLLHSQAISQNGGIQYVANSTYALGNDGNHYKDSINKMPNAAVPQLIANALHYASDHLPVLASYLFNYGTTANNDVGVVRLVSPSSSNCSSNSKTLSVRIKNFSTSSINFSQYPVTVKAEVIHPSSTFSNFSILLSSGSLAAGDSALVTFGQTVDMTQSGNYSIRAYTQLVSDNIMANDTLNWNTAQVYTYSAPVVVPQGPLQLCSGGQVVLNSSPANEYLWNNGATTASISVNTAGTYFVTITDNNSCTFSSNQVQVSVSSGSPIDTLFVETMGTAPTTTSIATHELNDGFDNLALTMSGSADVRNTSASTTASYSSASGTGNVFITNVTGRNFIISGINTINYSSLQLSFGIYKSTTAGTGSDLQVAVSTDGTNYTTLSYAALPSGSGTATWYYRTTTGVIPATNNLFVRFQQTGTTTQYRIDDVMLKGEFSPIITASGPTSFCIGDSVILTASNGNDFLWNTGATTQSIKAYSSGNYSVNVNCKTTSPITVTANNCDSINLQITAFLEGFYDGAGLMKAVVDPINYPTITDTILVLLASSNSPYTVVDSIKGILEINGTCNVILSPSLYGNSYYLIIKHRNSLTTWSAAPVVFNSSSVNYNFATGAAQAFGNNQKNAGTGIYAIISGDINQDGVVNQSDFLLGENYASLFLSGYLPGDLNGDGIIESADISLLENNASIIYTVQHP